MADNFQPIAGDPQALAKRGISEETCKHFGYTVGCITEEEFGRMGPSTQKQFPVGTRVQLAPYYDESGRIVAQKMRSASKDFGVAGRLKNALPLFGQHLWRDGGRKVVITEGELDAMSVSQLQGNKWPVVSVPNGADGAKKSLSEAIEWLERFDEVILMFDQDDPGRKAVDDCAALFTPGKCKVARLPLKDANEMLQAGRGEEVIKAIWDAKEFRPDGILSVADVYEEAIAEVLMGAPWWSPTLTALTYGRREGECYAFGAGTGIGKTDWFTQSIVYDATVLGLKAGLLYLEQPPVETVRRLAGKLIGVPIHIPGKSTHEQRVAAVGQLRDDDRISLYNSFGGTKWENVKSKIRYMVVAQGCKSIYLDHLTALVSQEEDERKALDAIMDELASLALELKCYLHFISHLTRPPAGATPHEEGGRVKQAQFRGSNAIGMWSHFMFGLERNTQAEAGDDDYQVTTFRVVKDRYTGQSTGKTIALGFDPATGRLYETESSAQQSPFKDRSHSHTEEF